MALFKPDIASICFSTCALVSLKGRPHNRCIEQPGAFVWRDSALEFRYTEPAKRIAQCEDVTAGDVRVFTKYLAEGGDGRDTCEPPLTTTATTTTTPCVRR
ncbi:hypothetical protein C8Q77DRAFT_1083115 [Trametes polyzona]|nr:hypothetical protein C8Q77DRAFT_1083115 [Trametes polyzona]